MVSLPVSKIRLTILAFYFLPIFLLSNSSAEPLCVESRIAGGEWKSPRAIEPLHGNAVYLRIRKMDGASIRWFQIKPDINIRYNNAVWPWLPNAYKWKGYDQIKYERIHLSELHGKWEFQLLPDKRCTSDSINQETKGDSLFSYIWRRIFGRFSKPSFFNKCLGSFWFQAEVTKGADVYKTPGIESNNERGLSPKVFRVSIKKSDDLLGNLMSYFNVPAVFGSTPYQVRNHIGIDCADVLMAAYSKTKSIPIKKDYNVVMLTSKFRNVVKSSIDDGKPASTIRWRKDIRAGDFIAVKRPGGKIYQHIGALYSDQNDNAVLDREDLILHAGPDPLHFSRLKSGVFDGPVVILRPH